MIEIPLTQGVSAVIDREDCELVGKYKWHANRMGSNVFYAVANLSRKVSITGGKILMHRLIMSARSGDIIDHINGDGADNRKCNLRVTTKSQNMQNSRAMGGTSRYRGVSKQAASSWMARIKHDRKAVYIGIFSNEVLAAKAYDRKATELFGELASLNFPDGAARPATIPRRLRPAHTDEKLHGHINRLLRDYSAGEITRAIEIGLGARYVALPLDEVALRQDQHLKEELLCEKS